MGVKTSCDKVQSWFRDSKTLLIIISLQFGSAGMFVITKDAFNKGMSFYVYIAYRNIIATITLAPFAYFLERKARPKMTVRIFSEIFAVAFVEIIFDQCFTNLGMQCTTASFASAVMNSAPSITFVMAIIFRLESMKIKERPCQAKVIGTVISLGGALLMALYKGPVVGSSAGQVTQSHNASGNQWLIGACFLLIGCAGFSAFYILQAITLRKYPAEMSLVTWICFVGSLQSTALTIFAERHHPHACSIGWDSKLLACAYSGVVISAFQYYAQGHVIKKKGPVFVTAFIPLRMILTVVLGCIIIKEKFYLGSVIGGVVVVTGLHLVVWGKAKEQKNLMRAPKIDSNNGNEAQLVINGGENKSEIR